VQPQTGLLVPTEFTKSEDGTELGPLTHLNGHISAEKLCKVVGQGLALSAQAKQQTQEAARAAYRQDKAGFLHRMQQLKRFLAARQQEQRQKWRQRQRQQR
jgi:hypothetical protein